MSDHAERELQDVLQDVEREMAGIENPFHALEEEIQRFRGVVRGVLLSLSSAIAAKHFPIYEHSRRVSSISAMIGVQFGFIGRELETLEYGGLLHDVGKIGMPEALLTKATKLSDDEVRIMQGHPDRGDRIIRKVPDLDDIANIVRWHHEREDGSGYPDRRTSGEIPVACRIVAAADTFDALTTPRPFRPRATPITPAMATMQGLAGKKLDVDVVEALLRLEGDPALEKALRNEFDGSSHLISPAR
ncbi:MAG: hypothetical protein CME06_15105 [Gemmatimonadetes bacterium]|nr:hypothetical protein [Gemmatimonadota bacterium]